MTQRREIKSVITVGGAVASSLPSSMKRATKELERLTFAQRQDEREARRLQRSMRGLGRGTDEYKRKAAQLVGVQQRLDFREGDITKAGLAARGAGSKVGGLASGFTNLARGAGPAGIAIGGIIGILGGLTAVLTSAGREAQDFLNLSTITGATTDALQKTAGGYDDIVAGNEAAIAATEALHKAQNTLRLGGLENLSSDAALALSSIEGGLQSFLQKTGTGLTDALIRQRQKLLEGGQENPLLRAFDRVLGTYGEATQALIIGASSDSEKLAIYTEGIAKAVVKTEEELQARKRAAENTESLKDVMRELTRKVADLLIPAIDSLVTAIGRIPGVNLPDRPGAPPPPPPGTKPSFAEKALPLAGPGGQLASTALTAGRYIQRKQNPIDGPQKAQDTGPSILERALSFAGPAGQIPAIALKAGKYFQNRNGPQQTDGPPPPGPGLGQRPGPGLSPGPIRGIGSDPGPGPVGGLRPSPGPEPTPAVSGLGQVPRPTQALGPAPARVPGNGVGGVGDLGGLGVGGLGGEGVGGLGGEGIGGLGGLGGLGVGGLGGEGVGGLGGEGIGGLGGLGGLGVGGLGGEGVGGPRWSGRSGRRWPGRRGHRRSGWSGRSGRGWSGRRGRRWPRWSGRSGRRWSRRRGRSGRRWSRRRGRRWSGHWSTLRPHPWSSTRSQPCPGHRPINP